MLVLLLLSIVMVDASSPSAVTLATAGVEEPEEPAPAELNWAKLILGLLADVKAARAFPPVKPPEPKPPPPPLPPTLPNPLVAELPNPLVPKLPKPLVVPELPNPVAAADEENDEGPAAPKPNPAGAPNPLPLDDEAVSPLIPLPLAPKAAAGCTPNAPPNSAEPQEGVNLAVVAVVSWPLLLLLLLWLLLLVPSPMLTLPAAMASLPAGSTAVAALEEAAVAASLALLRLLFALPSAGAVEEASPPPHSGGDRGCTRGLRLGCCRLGLSIVSSLLATSPRSDSGRERLLAAAPSPPPVIELLTPPRM